MSGRGRSFSGRGGRSPGGGRGDGRVGGRGRGRGGGGGRFGARDEGPPDEIVGEADDSVLKL